MKPAVTSGQCGSLPQAVTMAIDPLQGVVTSGQSGGQSLTQGDIWGWGKGQPCDRQNILLGPDGRPPVFGSCWGCDNKDKRV